MVASRQFDKFVQVPEGRIHYVKIGSGYPLVVFPAGGSSMVSWIPALELLGEHFTCYGFEILGHGESDEPTRESFSIPDHGRSIDHALQVLNIHRAHFIGAQAGARLAIEMAASHPGRVDKLVLLATPLGDPRQTPNRALSNYFDENGLARPRTMESEKQSGIFYNLKPQWLEEMNKERLRAGKWTRIHSFTNAWYDMFARLPLVRATATLIMNTEHGGDRYLEMEDILVYNLQNASKVLLPGIGHTANVEDPKGFADAVVAFLK